MAYERQLNIAMERLDQSLARLYTLVKRNENKAALSFMSEGELKERFEELQNMVTISQTSPLGARGTSQTGRI